MITQQEKIELRNVLSDLDFAIRSESGASDSPDICFANGVKSLADAISCWAQILKLEKYDPLESSRLAELLVQFNTKCPNTEFPPQWIERAKDITSRMGSIVLEADITQQPEQKDLDQIHRILKSDSTAPTVLTDLLGLIGMDQVKREFARLYYQSKLAKNYDPGTLPAFSYNAIFQGKPGTEKSCVARMYFKLMKELGVIPASSIFLVETGASLIDHRADGLQKLLSSLRAAKGAVVCIDDAHQLLTSRAGRQALAAIVPLAAQHDTRYGRIVWILTGPSDEGIGALLAWRTGLQSRFPVQMIFSDFTEQELLAMFLSRLKLFKRAASLPATTTDQVTSARHTPSQIFFVVYFYFCLSDGSIGSRFFLFLAENFHGADSVTP